MQSFELSNPATDNLFNWLSLCVTRAKQSSVPSEYISHFLFSINTLTPSHLPPEPYSMLIFGRWWQLFYHIGLKSVKSIHKVSRILRHYKYYAINATSAMIPCSDKVESAWTCRGEVSWFNFSSLKLTGKKIKWYQKWLIPQTAGVHYTRKNLR